MLYAGLKFTGLALNVAGGLAKAVRQDAERMIKEMEADSAAKVCVCVCVCLTTCPCAQPCACLRVSLFVCLCFHVCVCLFVSVCAHALAFGPLVDALPVQ